MSSIRKPNPLTFIAGSGGVTKGKAVTVSADGKTVVNANAVTDKTIGVAMGDASEGQAVEVAGPGGGAKGLAGGSISAGDLVAPTTGGALIATTSATNRYIGVAQQDAASGDLFAMDVVPGLI